MTSVLIIKLLIVEYVKIVDTTIHHYHKTRTNNVNQVNATSNSILTADIGRFVTFIGRTG